MKSLHIHLEEDVGKNTHSGMGTQLDFNRTGTPLMKIVSEPDIETAEEAFEQFSDTGALEAFCDQVIAANPDKVAEFKGGNDKVLNWMTGQVMKSSGGKANPKVVGELLRGKLAQDLR